MKIKSSNLQRINIFLLIIRLKTILFRLLTINNTPVTNNKRNRCKWSSWLWILLRLCICSCLLRRESIRSLHKSSYSHRLSCNEVYKHPECYSVCYKLWPWISQCWNKDAFWRCIIWLRWGLSCLLLLWLMLEWLCCDLISAYNLYINIV